MQTITLKATTDENGILRVELPVDVANTEYEVVVVFQTNHVTQQLEDVPPDGTGARHAYEARRAGIQAPRLVDPRQAKDILHNEFADYLMDSIQRDDSNG